MWMLSVWSLHPQTVASYTLSSHVLAEFRNLEIAVKFNIRILSLCVVLCGSFTSLEMRIGCFGWWLDEVKSLIWRVPSYFV
jgi:hypothetical protein